MECLSAINFCTERQLLFFVLKPNEPQVLHKSSNFNSNPCWAVLLLLIYMVVL